MAGITAVAAGIMEAITVGIMAGIITASGQRRHTA